jgi:hypothetical protein
MRLGLIGSEVEIQEPDGFSIDPFEIAREARTASGLLVKDIIAVKNRYTLSYEGFNPEDTIHIKDLLMSGQKLNFIYDDSGVEEQAYVYIKSFPRELFVHDYNYSKNITITLEEI